MSKRNQRQIDNLIIVIRSGSTVHLHRTEGHSSRGALCPAHGWRDGARPDLFDSDCGGDEPPRLEVEYEVPRGAGARTPGLRGRMLLRRAWGSSSTRAKRVPTLLTL